MATAIMPDRDILPDTVKPKHYDLFLYNIELSENWTYDGLVTIELEVKQSTREICLNTHLLKIRWAKVSSPTKATFAASDLSYDVVRQRGTFSFEHDIEAGELIKLEISFQGVMNNDMAGFSRSKYKSTVRSTAPQDREDGGYYMFSTQFESCDARRAFPCFDEPNLKATFDFAIEIPEYLIALSNMPEKYPYFREAAKQGCILVEFERSPIMSTYLLAWVSLSLI